MTKNVLRSEQDFRAFAANLFGIEPPEEFNEAEIKRPESYPCIAIICENQKNGIEYVTLQELLQVEFDVLNVSETGIVVVRIEDMEAQDSEELEVIHQALKNLGLSGLLVDHNDEIKEVSHQTLVNTAHKLGYEIKAKGRA